VSSASEFKKARADARPGEEILLAPRTYDDNFTASHSGTSAAPVTLCGPRSAVLNGGRVSRGYGHGFFVQNDRLQTVVGCDNEVSGAALGLSTIACTPA
jgi:hypothetical protein